MKNIDPNFIENYGVITFITVNEFSKFRRCTRQFKYVKKFALNILKY